MSLLCKLLGHKFVIVGENNGICSAHDCTRCGHHSPAIDWDAIAHPNGVIVSDKALSHDDMVRLKEWAENAGFTPLMAEPARPAPPMPVCKPPIEAVDNAALMCAIKELAEEVRQMRKQGRPFASGGMVPDDLRWINGNGPYQPRPTSAATATTRRGGPIPNIPQPT